MLNFNTDKICVFILTQMGIDFNFVGFKDKIPDEEKSFRGDV